MNPLKRTLALLIVAQVFCRTADGQQATLDSLTNARSYIRVTTGVDAAALGRISRLAADTLWLRFQREPLLIDEIAEIEVRTYHPDPLGNGGALHHPPGLKNACFAVGRECGFDASAIPGPVKDVAQHERKCQSRKNQEDLGRAGSHPEDLEKP